MDPTDKEGHSKHRLNFSDAVDYSFSGRDGRLYPDPGFDSNLYWYSEKAKARPNPAPRRGHGSGSGMRKLHSKGAGLERDNPGRRLLFLQSGMCETV